MPAASSSPASRREFIKTSTAVAAGALATATVARSAHAAGSDILKVALIGCGGRGTSAAQNAMRADKNAKLTVLCDVFPDRLADCRRTLGGDGTKPGILGEQFAVTGERCFTGFEGYKKVMEMGSEVDVVLLCTPPAFRPAQLKAAVEAGKHVFCEKPVAVDGPGVRSVLESAAQAKAKNLNLVSGLCWRYDYGVRETMKQIQDGAIGEIVAVQENYLTGTLWHRGREPKWSEMEYQMRNWLYFTWLSGDHIVEQHIHSLDKGMWLMGDKPPLKCFGLGGRQQRTDPQYGHAYDHFAVCYEWASGQRIYAYTRQMAECAPDVDDYVLGTKGQAVLLKHVIKGENTWRYKGPKPSMYDVEHAELFAAIRSGNTINNGEYMSYSTLLAIMGREACYTGQSITWEDAMKSTQTLGPDKYEWGDVKIPDVAVPGVTKFA